MAEVDERLVARAALEAAEDHVQSLCSTHASTFVAVERRGAALQASLSDLLQSISSAAPCVASAQESLQNSPDDEAGLSALAERHRLRRRTLLQHSSLLELLELPSLMDACVRSGLYDEALSIAGFANTLERRHLLPISQQQHAPDQGSASSGKQSQQTVVVGVVAEVRRRESELRRHLLHRLKGDVSMPQCLEVVTALRRLNGVELERRAPDKGLERLHAAMELKLQVDFLEARDVWLDAASSPTAPTTSAPNPLANQSEQILDSIEKYRTRCASFSQFFSLIFVSMIYIFSLIYIIICFSESILLGQML
jgi:hypothetical protein